MSPTPTPKTQQIEIELPPIHVAQRAIVDSPVRFKTVAAGRRFGKSRLGSLLCTVVSLSGGRSWWVGPSYPVASIGWREIKALAVQIPQVEIREVERLIRFPSGGSIQVKSADNPDSLRGEGLNFVVLDECAFIREEAWTHALRPALSDRKGKALFISTPKGRNWFWRIFQRGQDPHQTEWQSWRFKTVDNPFIDPQEVEAARENLPEVVFLQEYEAAFLEEAGGVFRRILEAATAAPQDKARSGQYVMGVDWGRTADATVIAVISLHERALVALDRMNRIDYGLQIARLKSLAEKFQPVIIEAEYNSMGGPLVEQLQSQGLPVHGFVTSNSTKAEIIQGLTLGFERGELRILPDPVLLGELQAYESRRLPSGLIQYGAPEGMHDDTVIALALAWWAAQGGNRSGIWGR